MSSSEVVLSMEEYNHMLDRLNRESHQQKKIDELEKEVDKERGDHAETIMRWTSPEKTRSLEEKLQAAEEQIAELEFSLRYQTCNCEKSNLGEVIACIRCKALDKIKRGEE